jgi:phosphatidylserine decarboxylase precursor
MYLRIINRQSDPHGTQLRRSSTDESPNNMQFIVYYHTADELFIYVMNNGDVMNVDHPGNLTMFSKENTTSDVKWIFSLKTSHYDQMDSYLTESYCLRKVDINANTILVEPIDAFKMIDESSTNKKQKYIYHVEHQVLFEEYISENVYKMLDVMYTKIRSKHLHDTVIKSFIRYFSKLIGHYYDSENSLKQITPFITEYNIDLTLLPTGESSTWKNFNDFFSRKIDLNFRPIEEFRGSFSIVSPADSRIVCFKQSKTMSSYIKNPKFVFDDIIQSINKQSINELDSGSGLICRLAPQDYHHFHSCMDGEIVSIATAGNALHSVNPISMKSSSVNVLNDNARIIFKIINTEMNITCYYVIIGASLVGSLRFATDKIARIYQHLIDNNLQCHVLTQPVKITLGEDLGTFLYGGSTIVLIFDKPIHFRRELRKISMYVQPKENEEINNLIGIKSKPIIESYCYVRSYIGTPLGQGDMSPPTTPRQL